MSPTSERVLAVIRERFSKPRKHKAPSNLPCVDTIHDAMLGAICVISYDPPVIELHPSKEHLMENVHGMVAWTGYYQILNGGNVRIHDRTGDSIYLTASVIA